jgi:hypothetical protein
MRHVCVATAIVGLLSAVSLGAVGVKLTADNLFLTTGQTTTVRVLAQGSTAGIASVAGGINALGTPGLLTSDPGSLGWVSQFASDAMFPPEVGAAGSNGGWSDFGSQQTDYLSMDSTYGKDDFVEVAHYTVTAGAAQGLVSLSFLRSPVTGFKCVETDQSVVMGTFSPVTIAVNVPEPLTLALLGLGGLLIARRRQ